MSKCVVIAVQRNIAGDSFKETEKETCAYEVEENDNKLWKI